MPILKQLVSGQSQTKRRSRMDLTTEMISAPLGDFRHTMHVGRSGDAFGDTSFLSSRSGEPPQAPTTSSGTFPRSPKPGGLLSRTFRSSKRSQSVTRVDQRENTLLPPSGSPTFVKNALSLPFLNNEGGDGSEVGPLKSLASSLTSSPSKQRNASSNGVNVSDLDQGMDLELHERCFGELTDLRPSPSYNSNLGGIKRAESVMSFHVDLGPSMLGDILDVMEKEDDDQGFEEGKGSEGRASPLHGSQAEGEEEEGEEEEEEEEEEDERGTQPEAPLCAPELNLEVRNEAESEPEVPKQADSCSVSSSDSHVLENKASSGQTDSAGAEDTDSAHYGYHPGEDGAFSSFMEDEDDEIRV